MKQLSEEARQQITEDAKDVMEIVLKVAARRLVQSLEAVHDTSIQPLRDLMKEAVEHVRHDPSCPGIKGGDAVCDCGAVEYLDRVTRALG